MARNVYLGFAVSADEMFLIDLGVAAERQRTGKDVTRSGLVRRAALEIATLELIEADEENPDFSVDELIEVV